MASSTIWYILKGPVSCPFLTVLIGLRGPQNIPMEFASLKLHLHHMLRHTPPFQPSCERAVSVPVLLNANELWLVLLLWGGGCSFGNNLFFTVSAWCRHRCNRCPAIQPYDFQLESDPEEEATAADTAKMIKKMYSIVDHHHSF